MTPVLTVTPVKPADLPTEEAIISEAKDLIKSISGWEHGKTYFDTVKTLTGPRRPTDGAPWHCRISEHERKEITFDALWEKLSKDKAMNEKQFIHELKNVQCVSEISPTATVWTLLYRFTPPVSPRTFTVVQIIHFEETNPRTGLVVSIPIDPSAPEDAELAKLEEKGVRGRYASVERVMELENGNTEWLMATSSTAGGSIPKFITEMTLPKKISEDVPRFMKWFRSLPKE